MDVPVTFTGTAAQPISEVQKLQQQVVRLEERLSGASRATGEFGRSGIKVIDNFSGQVTGLVNRYLGFRSAIRLVSEEMQHQKDIGQLALKDVETAAEAEAKFLTETIGRNAAEVEQLQRGIDDLIRSGKAAGVPREQIQAAVGAVPKEVPPEQAVHAAEIASQLFRAQAKEMQQFTLAQTDMARALGLTIDQAASMVLKNKTAANSFKEIGDAALDLTKKLTRFVGKGTLDEQLNVLEKSASMQHRVREQLSDTQKEILRSIIPHEQGISLDIFGRERARNTDRQRVIRREEAFAERRKEPAELLHDLVQQQAKVAESQFRGFTGEQARTTEQTQAQRLEAAIGQATKVISEESMRTQESALSRFVAKLDEITGAVADVFVTATPRQRAFGQLNRLDTLVDQALEKGKTEESVTLIREMITLLQAIRDSGTGTAKEQEETNRLLEAVQGKLKEVAPAANVNQHVEARKN